VGSFLEVAPSFRAEITKKVEGEVTLRFSEDTADLFKALYQYGMMPLPPYIKRNGPEEADYICYQTVYAQEEGAVAAPTAGLHFTPALLDRLKLNNIDTAFVTLHVGAGTFLPVKTDYIQDHKMHAEYGVLGQEVIDQINVTKSRGNKVVAVGTTSLRLLESAARGGALKPFNGDTDIFITPGYRFQVVDRLLTNFHLPKSTLFMLVCAFAGTTRMHQAYAHAINHGYRFYSYGDACLLDKNDG